MTSLKWRSKKPKFTKDCILIVATWISVNPGYWEYTMYEVKKTDSEDGWYWGIFCDDGDEWGDLADLHADYYTVIEPRKPIPARRQKALASRNN